MGLLRLDFIDYTTEIEAPVEKVFSLFQKVEEWPLWTSAIKRAYTKSDGAWGVGFGLGFVPYFALWPIEVKLVDYQENRLIEWGIRSPLATIIHRFEFEPLGKDRCSVRQREFAEGLFAIFSRPFKGVIERFDRLLGDDLKAAFNKKG